MEDLLRLAEAIARVAHKNQFDKCGVPYINHPKTVSEFCNTIEGKIVGWLHDVVEDTHVTIDSLRNLGFPDNILEALRCVTKEEGYDEAEYYERIKNNQIAKEVKLADLKHNSDLSRIPEDAKKELREKLQKKHDIYLTKIEYLKGM